MVFALMLATYSASAQCTANYSYETDTFGTTNFTDLSTFDSVLTYNWNFGDGNFSALQHPSNNYATDSVYLVVLMINDSLAGTYPPANAVTSTVCSPSTKKSSTPVTTNVAEA